MVVSELSSKVKLSKKKVAPMFQDHVFFQSARVSLIPENGIDT